MDADSKIRSLQCLWIQKLCDDSFHELKQKIIWKKASFSTLIFISKLLS